MTTRTLRLGNFALPALARYALPVPLDSVQEFRTTVAGQGAGAGEHQVAHACEPGERLGTRARGLSGPLSAGDAGTRPVGVVVADAVACTGHDGCQPDAEHADRRQQQRQPDPQVPSPALRRRRV